MSRLLTVALTLTLFLTIVPFAAAAPAPPVAKTEALAAGAARAVLMQTSSALYQAADDEGELDDLDVLPIDPALDPDTILRSRPFVLGANSVEAFPNDMRDPNPMAEDHARDRLKRFLYRRDLDREVIDQAAARYDDPAVQAIVPSPSLRAALLMLTEWGAYQSTIDAILDGDNPSGEPFEAVEFQDIEIADAIATVAYSRSGRFRMIFNLEFAAEPPEQLLPVIVHEALHGGGVNSLQEEVIANILDSICYSEVLLVDPRVAKFRTELTLFNNVEVLALINSMGRAGGGQLGITTSPLGDVFVGPNLEDFDAESIRAVIESDSFYGALPPVGSPGQATFTALINRFAGGDQLGEEPDFTDEALTVIDAGVGEIITPRETVRLARILGLDMTGAITEGPPPGPIPSTLGERPFIPASPDLFTRRAAQGIGEPLDEEDARDALEATLVDLDASRRERARLLERYDAEDTAELIPDPSLRAAVVLLHSTEPWHLSAAAILNGENAEGTPLHVLFADLPGSTPVMRARAGGRPSVILNSWLEGESPGVLASYIVEGTLLHGDRATDDEMIAATLLGSLAYATFVLAEPALVDGASWGIIERNRDMLALVNSTSWRPSADLANADSIGFMRPSNGAVDILPGVYDDADSFADFVSSKPRPTHLDGGAVRLAQPVFKSYLEHAGVAAGVGGATSLDDETMEALDARLGAFLPVEDALRVAEALQLGAGWT